MLIEYIKEDKIALIDSKDKKLIEKFLLNGYELKQKYCNDNLVNDDIIENKPAIKKRGRSKKDAE